ncbi:MAG TPA: glycosyltransferase, partial [Gemmatimonadales bacterium]|nr:glycosyltransferase [Gemmatimonadales bacterium]
MGRSIPVVHVITGLVTGGAETALARLLAALPAEEFPATVVSLTSGGPVADHLRAIDVRVETLGMHGAASVVSGALRLRHLLRELRPALVQGWMHHGNLAASIGAAGILPRQAVLWNVRMTVYDMALEGRATRLAIRAGRIASGCPGRIIYNSEVARQQHEAAGYGTERGVVIPNGFDATLFAPDPRARAAVRAELGVPEGRLLVGLVGRYHVMKGHDDFLAAARQVLAEGVDADFVCAGREVTPDNPVLTGMVTQHDLAGRVHLLGERRDTHRLFAALDVACCASTSGEGFPNAVGEAMACGIPCVVTEVGDAPVLVGETGVVVSRHDPQALAAGMMRLLRLPADARAAVGTKGRARIK